MKLSINFPNIKVSEVLKEANEVEVFDLHSKEAEHIIEGIRKQLASKNIEVPEDKKELTKFYGMVLGYDGNIYCNNDIIDNKELLSVNYVPRSKHKTMIKASIIHELVHKKQIESLGMKPSDFGDIDNVLKYRYLMEVQANAIDYGYALYKVKGKVKERELEQNYSNSLYTRIGNLAFIYGLALNFDNKTPEGAQRHARLIDEVTATNDVSIIASVLDLDKMEPLKNDFVLIVKNTIDELESLKA